MILPSCYIRLYSYVPTSNLGTSFLPKIEFFLNCIILPSSVLSCPCSLNYQSLHPFNICISFWRRKLLYFHHQNLSVELYDAYHIQWVFKISLFIEKWLDLIIIPLEMFWLSYTRMNPKTLASTPVCLVEWLNSQ